MCNPCDVSARPSRSFSCAGGGGGGGRGWGGGGLTKKAFMTGMMEAVREHTMMRSDCHVARAATAAVTE